MHSYLQTKAVSLQLEAQYIRKQESRFRQRARIARLQGKDRLADWAERNRFGQYHHRVTVVRQEARITNIARAFLIGKKYSQIERIVYTQPDWNRVLQLVVTYVERDNPKWNRPVIDVFNEWKDAAKEHFNNVPPRKPKVKRAQSTEKASQKHG